MKRQIVLDTETTGLEHSLGHRVIEIGCVELVDRRFTGNNFHCYLNPDREIDAGAIEIHGITNEFLHNKPHFADIRPELVEFLTDGELVIHNAAFDVGFLNNELRLDDSDSVLLADICTVVDSLQLARKLHPGQKNNLDALCKRYGIDNSQRTLHGALLDAEILADVYLLMSGGQTAIKLEFEQFGSDSEKNRFSSQREPGKIIAVDVNSDDLQAHQRWLNELGEDCVWNR
ncbi:MAG: DNA polymerase-3 subunit epsilon [Parasphingorhabdus sp.]|jgi:DNA polymerase-3 subunit epsilon